MEQIPTYSERDICCLYGIHPLYTLSYLFSSNASGHEAVLGCDFVGEVTKLEDTVTRLDKGDTVAGLIWGGES